MLKKLFRLAGVVVMLACSTAVFAKTSDSKEILTEFTDYNHQYISSVQGGVPEAVKISINASLNQGLNKYVADVETVELAACMDSEKMKDFIKKCNKVIKKSKLPKISSIKNDEIIVKVYAEGGRIICLSQIDDDLAAITVVTGVAPRE